MAEAAGPNKFEVDVPKCAARLRWRGGAHTFSPHRELQRRLYDDWERVVKQKTVPDRPGVPPGPSGYH